MNILNIKSLRSGLAESFMLLSLILAVSSCGNTPKTGGAESDQSATEVSDLGKEQAALNKEIKSELDSLIIDAQCIYSGKEKTGVRGVYSGIMLSPKQAGEAVTLCSRYATLAMIQVDREVVANQKLPVSDYDKCTKVLISEINDPALMHTSAIAEASSQSLYARHDTKQLTDNIQKYYDEETDAGRSSFFWTVILSGMVEHLYLGINGGVISFDNLTDAQASNISRRISIIMNNINRLAEHDENVEKIAAALSPFNELNASNSKDFQKQIGSINSRIARMRERLLER